MIRFLVYNILFLLLLSCKSYQPTQSLQTVKKTVCNPYFSDLDKEYIYTTNIKAYNRQFTGLLAIKFLPNNQHRVALTTEFGNTLLDLTIYQGGYVKNYAIPELDKKIILRILSHDLFIVLNSIWQIDAQKAHLQNQVYKAQLANKKYFLVWENELLTSITYAKRKKKVVVNFTSDTNQNATFIHIKHYNLDIEMFLEKV